MLTLSADLVVVSKYVSSFWCADSVAECSVYRQRKKMVVGSALHTCGKGPLTFVAQFSGSESAKVSWLRGWPVICKERQQVCRVHHFPTLGSLPFLCLTSRIAYFPRSRFLPFGFACVK